MASTCSATWWVEVLRRGLGVASLLLAACAGDDVVMVPVAQERARLEQATALLGSGDAEKAAELAEEILEHPAHPDVTPEALFLAGKARLRVDERRKAFDHFRALIRDYPLSPRVPEIADDLYAMGQWYLGRPPRFLFGHLFSGRERGLEILREYQGAFPQSQYADDALLQIADFHFAEEEFDLAAPHYEELLKNYPRSEWADRAAFQVGMSHYRSSRGISYDRTPLARASEAFRAYLRRSEFELHHTEAELLAKKTEEMLAHHELRVAKFYLLRHSDRGARTHLANAVLAFPGTPSAEKARLELDQRGWDLTIHSLDQLIKEGILRRGGGP